MHVPGSAALPFCGASLASFGRLIGAYAAYVRENFAFVSEIACSNSKLLQTHVAESNRTDGDASTQLVTAHLGPVERCDRDR